MSHFRRINGLLWAKPCEAPEFARRGPRPTGTKAKGLAYERAVAAAMPGALHGQWFEFQDRNGPGYCQPDLLLRGWVVEVKLTDVREAEAKILGLYIPVLEAAWGGTWRGLKIVKGLQPWSTGVVGTRAEAAQAPGVPTLHWLGGHRVP